MSPERKVGYLTRFRESLSLIPLFFAIVWDSSAIARELRHGNAHRRYKSDSEEPEKQQDVADAVSAILEADRHGGTLDDRTHVNRGPEQYHSQEMKVLY